MVTKNTLPQLSPLVPEELKKLPNFGHLRDADKTGFLGEPSLIKLLPGILRLIEIVAALVLVSGRIQV